MNGKNTSVKKRKGEPWMPAAAFGRSMQSGVGVYLPVPEIAEMVEFCRAVWAAPIVPIAIVG